MKKFFIIFGLLAFTLSFAGCGGGGGSLDSPKGENPGKATLVELTPSHFVSHTNSDITLHAKVLDGNGNPVANKPVRFTNLSPIGTLNKITDKTDSAGIATVTLHSHEVGYATIQAEVDEGLNQVRDRKVVYYSSFNLMWPEPQIVLEVDADGDGIYNETNDFNFFETPSDDNATLRATAYDEFGKRIVGMNITFSGDSGASFPLGNVFKTNSAGQAFTTLKVSPTSVVGQETSLNIYATGANNAVGFLQVFLRPVSITGITLVANPLGVISQCSETSTITAYITTSAGTIPDDLAVQFSVSPVTSGFVEPLVALTDNGVASTLFTPSDTDTGDVTISAIIGNVTGQIIVNIAPPISIAPTTRTLTDPAVGDPPVTYTISGGIAPYTATTTSSNIAVEVVGTTLTVTVTVLPSEEGTTSHTIIVSDSHGCNEVQATLIITITTVASTDTTPPTVVWTIPVDTAINVPVGGDLVVRFSEDLDPTTISMASFSIFDNTTATAYVPACAPAVNYDPITFTATYVISDVACANFSNSHNYTATITTDVRDLAGNPLAAAYIWSFTTTP